MRDYYAESLKLMEKTAPEQRKMQFIKVYVYNRRYSCEARLLMERVTG